jgi:hypothetical protein
MITITITGDAATVRQAMMDLLGQAPITIHMPPEVEKPIESLTTASEPAPKAKGRPKGPPAAKLKPDPAPQPTPPPPEVVTPEPELPSEKDVQDVVVAVNDKFGIDKAIECLSKFQVKRARELREDQRAAFITHCKSML